MTPTALTIAGSDSGGGAGIQADLKTFHAFGVFGTSAVTALTAQNTRGVHDVHVAPAEIVRAQIRAVADDLEPAACKTGMLGTATLVSTVAEAIGDMGLANYVLDPVMVATSGDRLLDRDAERAMANRLLPLCRIATPNIPEAAILTEREIHDEDGMRDAARELVRRGARAALVKGGHLEGDTVVDLLYEGTEFRRWVRPRLATRNTHGTGCTLSSAIAAGLARGRSLADATEAGLAFVHHAMREAPDLGDGNGPLNHFVSLDAVSATT